MIFSDLPKYFNAYFAENQIIILIYNELLLIKQDKLLIPLQVRQYHLQTHGGIYLLNNINYGKTELKKTYI